MAHANARLEEAVYELRQMLPTHTATAQQAIDQHEPWEQIAMEAIDDSYVENAAKLVGLGRAEGPLAPYRARRFEAMRSPICGTFGCGGYR